MFAKPKEQAQSKQLPTVGVSLAPCTSRPAIITLLMNKILDILGIRKALAIAYRKFGKKALYIFLIYFVVKWTLTLLFGAKILAFLRDIF